jgi:hypothetical protein
MTKRICLLQRDEFGFSNDLETLTPRKLPADELQTFRGFMDYDVKQMLKRTNDDDRRLAWIDDRPGSYTVRQALHLWVG